MTTMSPSLVSALVASLSNPQHAWSVASAASHVTPSQPGLLINTGGLTPVTVQGPPSDALLDKTFQLQSEPLELILVAMAHLRNGVFEDMDVYYRGTSFETSSALLYAAIVAIAEPEIETIASDFEAMVRKKFVTSQLSASGSMIVTATKV